MCPVDNANYRIIQNSQNIFGKWIVQTDIDWHWLLNLPIIRGTSLSTTTHLWVSNLNTNRIWVKMTPEITTKQPEWPQGVRSWLYYYGSSWASFFKPAKCKSFLYCESSRPRIGIRIQKLMCLWTGLILALRPVSCYYVTSFNYVSKKTRNVGPTCRCHLNNIMSDSIFYDSIRWGITSFFVRVITAVFLSIRKMDSVVLLF